MRWAFPSRTRHPLFADLGGTPASSAKGCCTALCGTYEDILRAADAGVKVERALFITVAPDGSLPGEPERDRLWNSFGVPAFAMLADHKGRVLAYECEAFAGLHAASGAPDLSEHYTRESTLCECGRPGDRWVVR
jgi:hypothetical protein